MSSHSRIHGLLDKLTLFVMRHRRAVLLVALLAGAFGVWRASKLKINQDLKALIPDDYQSVVRLEEVGSRIGSQSELILELRARKDAREKLIEYGTILEQRMAAMDGVFQSVELRRDVDWFKDHALLYLPIGKLLEIRARVVDRIRKEVRKQVVEDIDDEREEPAREKPAEQGSGDDPFDLDEDELQDKYGAQYDVPTEYMEVLDEHYGEVVMVLRGRPLEPTTNVKFTEQLMDQMRKLLADVDPGRFDPSIQATIKGEYEERSGEMSSIKTELLGSSLYALVMLVLLIVWYFQRFRALLLVVGPLVASILLTLGISTFVYESLNLVTAFIFVVLLGLGIDFGIHLLARYEHERHRGEDQEGALRISCTQTGLDVTLGALTTIAMFCTFPVADFRGFSQFGVIAAIGVLTALVFSMTALPALIVETERWLRWKPRSLIPRPAKDPAAWRDASSRLFPSSRRLWAYAITILVVSLAAAVAGGFAAREIRFEYDFGKLGRKPDPSKQEEDKGPERKNHEDAIGRPNFGPGVALARDVAQGRLVEDLLRGIKTLTDSQMARLVREARAPDFEPWEHKGNDPDRSSPPPPVVSRDADLDEDDDPFAVPERDEFADLQEEYDRGDLSPVSKRVVATYPLARVREMRYFLWKHLSLWSFVPDRQAEKLRIVADIRKRIEAKYDELGDDSRKKADDFGRYLKVNEPVDIEHVPAWVRNRWMDNQGVAGRHAILWNRGAKADLADARRLYAAFFDLTVGDPDAQKGDPAGLQTVRMGANYFVLPEIMGALERDGPLVLGLSLAVIALCILLMFRSVQLTVFILIPVATSIAWLAGLFYCLDWKLNLYNVITFALIIGMGVDDGIHMTSRWVEEGSESVYRAVRETGSAVAMTTATTCIGFGGLMFANHVGLSTLGWTAAVGMGLCLLTTVTTLPALLYLVGRRRTRRAAEAGGPGGRPPGQTSGGPGQDQPPVGEVAS